MYAAPFNRRPRGIDLGRDAGGLQHAVDIGSQCRCTRRRVLDAVGFPGKTGIVLDQRRPLPAGEGWDLRYPVRTDHQDGGRTAQHRVNVVEDTHQLRVARIIQQRQRPAPVRQDQDRTRRVTRHGIHRSAS